MTQVVTHLDEGDTGLPRHQIFFRVYQRGGFQDQGRSQSYSDPSEVKRVAFKYVQKGMRVMTMGCRGLSPERCYDAVVADGTYTVLVVSSHDGEINKLRIAYGVGSVAKNEPHEPKRRKITER